MLNSTLYAQTDGTNKIYFQYKGSTPLGFILNDVQYFYITNLSGDVVGITDIDGNLIAEYTYDEWGKLLAITPAEEDNAEQLTIAETNPLRYRGYYYDNETGLYYLQSRYYNPELGRFISADDFNYIDSYSKFSINAYSYCENDPINCMDPDGYIGEVVGGTALYYFINYVLPEIIVYGILFVSGAYFLYIILNVIIEAAEGAGSSSSVTPPDDNDEVKKALDKIPNKLKNGKKVDLNKFKTKLKNGQGYKADNGWRIQKDTSGHKGSEWKLFDKSGNRIASLKGDGTVVGK